MKMKMFIRKKPVMQEKRFRKKFKTESRAIVIAHQYLCNRKSTIVYISILPRMVLLALTEND